MNELLDTLADQLRPYPHLPGFRGVPRRGLDRDAVLDLVRDMVDRETPTWRDGYASGTVYHGADDHIALLDEVWRLTSQTNATHADLWPSIPRMEREIVAMAADLLGGGHPVVGTVTTGGTESVLSAMKACRDLGRDRGVLRPRVIAPSTAHVCFDKAADYLGFELVRVPVGPDFRGDVEAMRGAIDPDTIGLVASAPCFSQGTVDPIADLGALAVEAGLWLHVDACQGGFVLPWLERLGYPVAPFDFRVPGVTSLSCDTHKFGFGAKGSSIVLYRDAALRRRQYCVATEWAGGPYFSPTLTGSRPGAMSAMAWAALLSMGQDGFLDAARQLAEVAAFIKDGVAGIDGVHVMGDPLWVLCIGSHDLDVYALLEQMAARGWRLNAMMRPAGLHLCVTLRHAQPGVAQRFLDDLREAVAHGRHHRCGGLAAMYRLAADHPDRDAVRDVLCALLDRLYTAP